MPDDGALVVEVRKVANLLALYLTREMSSTQKILALSICGFGNREIAQLLGLAEPTVRSTLSRQRKRPGEG